MAIARWFERIVVRQHRSFAEPRSGELLIETEAARLNYIDVY